MTRTPRRFQNAGPAVTLIVVFTLAMTLLGPSASSHSGLIARSWIRDKQVEFDFTPSIGSMPSGSQAKINQGAADWNELSGSVTLVPGGNVADYSPDECPANYQQNAMHFKPIDGPSKILAVATTCRFSSGNELFSMQITFDSGENWFAGGGNPSSNQIDLWAVATHEFGHTLGIAHFDAADAVCANNVRETMCPFYSLSQRIPADHDVHGFSAVYGGGPAPGADQAAPPPTEEPPDNQPPENEPPEAANASARVPTGVKFIGKLSASDPEGKAVKFELVNKSFNVVNHRFNLRSDGQWTIKTTARPRSRLTFSYRACDPEGACSDPRTVSITVTR